MKVLVTGKNGQLGWELSQQVPAETVFEAHDSDSLDITDSDAVLAKVDEFKPDVVINAAAYTAVDKAETDVEAAYLVNETGVANLATASEQHGAKLIHVSTDFVFGATKNTPYDPDDETAPLGVYGASKLAGEQQLSQILGSNGTVVRTAWVYSSHGNNFVKTMLRLMKEKEQLGVVSDQVGTPTYARNLASALWGLADKMFSGDAVQPVYHWTDLGTASWYDFAITIRDEALALGLLDKDIPVNPIFASQYPTPAKRPSYSVLDTSALREDLNMPGEYWRKALISMLKELA